MRLIILTGASGSGKTAIAKAIRIERPDLAEVLHFDSIGVPSPEAMKELAAKMPGGAPQGAPGMPSLPKEFPGLSGLGKPTLPGLGGFLGIGKKK